MADIPQTDESHRQDSALPLAESVHQCFCRSREAAKRLRFIALLLEAAVVAIGAWRFLAQPKVALLPLLVLVATVLEVVFRHLVKTLRTYGQRCRRNSLRAYAQETDSDPVISVNLRVAMPRIAILLTPFYQSQPLERYYTFRDMTPGDRRLRAITAYSAFFSARVLAIWSALLLTALCLVVGGGVYVLYVLAMSSTTPEALRLGYVDVLFTILWWYATVRLLATFLTSRHLTDIFDRVFDLLERTPAGDGRTIHELVEEYDYNRVSGFEAPTLLYRLTGPTIEKKWAIVRSTFVNPSES
jgi:hypothetical protein